MERIIRVGDQYYILATSSFADDRTRVIKEGETFGVFDRYGDIQPVGMGEQGVYHEGTRFLSRLEMLLSGRRPFLLSSGIDDDNLIFSVDLANPDLEFPEAMVPRETLHIYRSKHLWGGVLYEYIRLRNFNPEAIPYELEISFGADFADIFEVRGQSRAERGTMRPVRLEPDRVVLGYLGLDDVLRELDVRFSVRPSELSESRCLYHGRLEGKQELEISVAYACFAPALSRTELKTHRGSAEQARKRLDEVRSSECEILASDQHFEAILHRSMSDLRMMVTMTGEGYYPYAGVPWFSAPFGRDGLITALQTLWINPEIGRGVLDYLSRTQATEVSATKDAEPGKIIHEVRNGEMALRGEVPFHRYYGSVDSTPLFVVLTREYVRRTGDEVFLERIWPNVERAMEWIDRYGDVDGDGFVEYARKTPRGLFNQGWKDSVDSVCHRDGSIAEGPIALCEVQGYVHAAKTGAAEMASHLGKTSLADRLLEESEVLRRRFEQAFWMEEEGYYALALDGRKRPCRVLASNAGHCLFTGILEPERADAVIDRLMEEDLYSGWGIRTLSYKEAFYNPMSYHNGSIWPHDNSMIGWGMGKLGRSRPIERMLGDLLDACAYFDMFRLPELFCGFKRRPGEGPTRYPVACSPQAWASGSVFLLLQSCLGMRINGKEREIRFANPSLPAQLDQLEIHNLRLGESSVDLHIKRHMHDVSIYVTRRSGPVSVHIFK
jgi:glycogen debranching enzyme